LAQDQSEQRPHGGTAARADEAALDGQAGLTLLELMIALAVMAMVVVGVTAGMSAAIDLARSNRSRSTAAYLAAEQLEQRRAAMSADPTADEFTAYPPPAPVTTTRTVNGVAYTMVRATAWVNPRTNTSACSAPTTTAAGQVLAYQRVRVEVTWPHMRGTAPVVSETLLTAAPDPDVGHLSVVVADRNGDIDVGRIVTATGPVTRSATVTDEGCAFMARLPAGNYTLTLPGGNLVDQQGVTSPSQIAGVTGGAVTSARFDADQAASILVTPAPAPVPDSMRVTVANSSLSLGTTTFAWTASANTAGPLFPFASGYSVWAGGCADADPTYTGFGGTRPAPVAVTPGGVSTAGAALRTQSVYTYRRVSGTNTPRGSTTLQATHSGGASCPAGNEVLTWTGVQTDAGGRATITLPYGTWTITALNRSTVTPGTVTVRPGVATTEVQVRTS
jgi:prepilin-type N-terminal cleavage/methylation domain-containing protein